MSETQRFTIGARLRSFVYAFRGIRTMLLSQHNARIHAAATLLAITAGVGLGVSRLEWCALIAAIVLATAALGAG